MSKSAVLVLLQLGLASQAADACSFAAGYRKFEAAKVVQAEADVTPTTRGLSVVSLERGYDDGNFASCSDAGTLTIAIDDAGAAKDLGFVFQLESGVFPDVVFPDYAVSPVDLGNGAWGFFFVWLDLPAGSKTIDPIDARVSVRAVSSTLSAGEKVFLDIRNP